MAKFTDTPAVSFGALLPMKAVNNVSTEPEEVPVSDEVKREAQEIATQIWATGSISHSRFVPAVRPALDYAVSCDWLRIIDRVIVTRGNVDPRGPVKPWKLPE